MKHLSALVLIIALLAFPSAALAQDATEGYGAVAGVSEGGSAPGTQAATREGAASGGSLPFTGLAIVMLAIAGALLIATGVGLRRSHATRT